jgi:EAL domain-containing protein (putative c-di-GMP-specific phosphodiesterase class I)/CHASE2 domain-containing sensor protein
LSAPVSKRRKQSPKLTSWKLLLWTAVAGLIFGLIGFGEIAENYLRASRNSLHRHPTSGDIVLVDIDDNSLRQLGRLPWSRGKHAHLIDLLTQAGAKRIFVDVMMDGRSDPREDALFAQALERSGRVILPAVSRFGPGSGFRIDRLPLPAFSQRAQVGSVTIHYNYQNAVWTVPYDEQIQGQPMLSYAALLANHSPKAGTFTVDYSLDPASVPRIPAAAIFNGKFKSREIAGKDVVVAVTSAAGSDIVFIPGTGPMGGAYVHILGAETLKSGTPTDLGWFPLFLLAIAVGGFAISQRNPRHQGSILGMSTILLLFGPALPEAYHVYSDVTPALFVIIMIGCALGWRLYRVQGLVNSVSNLPNLNALRASREGRKQALVAARVLNYEEIVATLPANSERQLIDQIVARLSVGSSNRILYQGDGGIFAWFEEPHQPFGNHLEALYSLFRNPARVAGLSIDLSIAFGVEIGSGRSLANRLASALVAVEEAAHDGLKWKFHDPESLEDASWKLSMLSQLDDAIDRGEVWVAYQPKLELATRRIVGAEALARWTHPEKGPIAASEFVAAAEQHNRIGKLTDYVLEKAVAAGAQINKRGIDFDVAVNLSAKLLTDKGFTLRLSALLARNGLPAERLTLELTETAALAGSGDGLDMITRLRDLGVRIAIDDYGTGLSTLDYLKKIPANEIKIDQSFVRGIVDNRSDRLMVQSTIGLAHSLGRKVVAEGVEHRDILDLLIEMGCDIAQGFTIGRPMSLESLAKRIITDRKRSAA